MSYTDRLTALADEIHSTLFENHRVFLFGCGATGRLSISLEVFCRNGLIEKKYAEKIIGFMSGGDLALIRSIEKFEDYAVYGENQLMELGFEDGDLLISTTEGGETPIVIGATEKAAEISKRKPWFLYCNPDKILIEKVARSRNIILNPKINKISFEIAPQALSGSTRMQASTILMLSIGSAFHHLTTSFPISSYIEEIIDFYAKTDLNPLAKFIETESFLYKSSEYLIYLTSQSYGVTILTDTTERSPTFTLNSFENTLDDLLEPPLSLSYLSLKGTSSSEEAWGVLLGRDTRTLEWEFCKGVTGRKRLLGYDISEKAVERRRKRCPKQNLFVIDREEEGNCVKFELLKEKWEVFFGKEMNDFAVNLVLKMILNIQSTLVMGRLGRYESNVMTFVKPSNFKLIDRSIRYIAQILREKYGLEVGYEEIMGLIGQAAEGLREEEPFVLKASRFIYEFLTKNKENFEK